MNDGRGQGRVSKKTRVVREGVENTFELDGLTVKTKYRRGAQSGRTRVKQVVTIANTADGDRTVEYRARMKIGAGRVIWDGGEYTISRMPLVFRAYQRQVTIPQLAKEFGRGDLEGLDGFGNYTHTRAAGSRIVFGASGARGIYDWSDALHLDPVVLVYRAGDGAVVEFVVQELRIPAGGEAVIDPIYGLDDQANYDLRFDGHTGILRLGYRNSVAVGDVNGDNRPDLVLGTESESAFVVFGGPGIATGDRPLDVSANYNIRYDLPPGHGLAAEGALVVGDVNGDGLGDLVLGAPAATYNGSATGSVFVILSTLVDDVGGSTGNDLSLTDPGNYNIRYDGGDQSDGLSRYGSITIGDVNGDGDGDLIIGGPWAEHNGQGSGSAWLIFSTLLDDVGITTGNNKPFSDPGNFNVRYDGGAESDLLTYSGSMAVGDLNGDGLGDLVLGSHFAGNNGASSGSAWVMFSTLVDDMTGSTGNTRLLSAPGSYNIRYDGAAASDQLTYDGDIAIGDLNGDGFGDLVLAAYNADNGGSQSGSAWVMFSTLIGDMTGTTGNDRPLSVPGNYNVRYDSGAASDEMTRYQPPSIGDVNGDGLGDLVLGAYGADNNGSRSGSAWVMFSTLIDDMTGTTGNDRPLSDPASYNIRYDGDAEDSLVGAVALGDVNGDGLGDLVLGAYWAGNNGTGSGSAWVVFSSLVDDVGTTTGNNKLVNDPANYNIRYDGENATDECTKYDGTVIGDLDGDGSKDLVLGVYLADNHGADSGGAYVVFSTLIDDVGTSTGNDRPLSDAGSYDIRYSGSVEIEGLAMEGAMAVGDVNGDSQPDLVVGTYQAHYNGSYSGSAFVIFGGSGIGAGDRPLDVSTSYNIRYDGGAADDQLTEGGAIAIGDVNGDGLGDLVLGASDAGYSALSAGSAWVIFSTLIDDVGTTTGNVKPLSDPGNFNIRYDGSTFGDHIAKQAVIGDVNGDGLGDLVVDAFTSLGGLNSGSVYIMLSTLIDDVGSTTGNTMSLALPASYNIRYDGGADNWMGQYGNLAIGDVSGDGLGDLVLGSYAASYNGARSGSVWVVFSTLLDDTGGSTGNDLPLAVPANYNIRYDGGAAGDSLSWDEAIKTGDVNGDGFGDLVVGAWQAGYNGNYSGSAYVMFSTLIDDVSGTGSDQPLSEPGNYNIRYDGGAMGDYLTSDGSIAIGDVNGDGLSDLVLGARGGDYNGYASGSAWVMFSTLVDDVGTSTGNDKPLSDPGNFNIRYDGGVEGDYLTYEGALAIGDFSGDGIGDLVLGSNDPEYQGRNSGSAWVMFSMLIDDVGATTGNVKPLSEPANYIYRFDGGGPLTRITKGAALAFADLDGIGTTDLVIGGPEASNNGYKSGSVWVIFGPCMVNADCPPCYQCSANACVYQAAGTDLKNECTAGECSTGNCDGSGFCGHSASGTLCTDTTPGDCWTAHCDGSGACDQIYAPDPPGTNCDDGEFCTDPDTCDGSGACVPGVGDPCTGGGECNQVCNEVDDNCFDPLDTPCGSDWDTDCDNPDTCDGAGLCRPNNELDGTGCDDGLYCTHPDSCTSGSCTSGPQRSCDDSEPCTQDTCDENADRCDNQYLGDGTPCDDGLYCTEGETCQAGACNGGTPVDCSGLDDECNTGVCNDVTDRCEADPVPKNGDPCDDDDICTENDICQDGMCAGTELDCSGSDGECVDGDCVDGRCQGFSSGEGSDCSGCYRCSAGEAGTVCDWVSSLPAGQCLEGLCRVDSASCDSGDNCVIEGYCDEEVEGCGIPVVYGKGAGRTLSCRLRMGKVGVRVEMEPASGGVGTFLPVRVHLTNTPTGGWSKCIYGLQLVIELNPEGEHRPGGRVAYVRRSALLQGGGVAVEEEVDEQNQRVVVVTLGGEDDCLPAPGDGGQWVLDFLLVRGTFEDGWFKVNVWAPCVSSNEVMGCHAAVDGGEEHRVSGNLFSYTTGKSFKEGEDSGQMLHSYTLGCQCGTGGNAGGLLALGILFLILLRTRANYLKRANRDVTHRFEA